MDRRCARQRGIRMTWFRVVVASVVLGLAASAAAFRNVEEGAKVPGFTLPTTTGQQLEFAGGGEQAVVLTIVRQGQEKSVSAMKALGELAEKFGDKVAVLAIVANPGDGDVARWVAGTGVGYPVLLDNGGDVYGSYGVLMMPTTGIVKPDGTLAGTVNGYTRAFGDEVERLTRVALGLISAEDAVGATVDPTAMKSEQRKKAERSVEKARLLRKRKMTAKALAAAEEAVALDGEYAAGRVLLGGMLLAASEDNAADALVHFEKALQLDPKSLDAKVGVARVKSIQGETDAAVALLQQAAMLNPKPEKVYFELGRVYERAGDYQNAVEAYRKALERLLR